MEKQLIIDCHTHICSVNQTITKSYMSKSMLKHPAIRYLLFKYKINKKESPEHIDNKFLSSIETELLQSKYVNRFVVLGLDAVYRENGLIDEKHTHYVVSTDYVISLSKKYKQFIPFGSIHPYRKDAIDLLKHYQQQGIKGIKWLPNIQGIDLTHSKSIAFCKELAKLDIPLLCHVGREYTLPTINQKYGNPNTIECCLKTGANIIAAHGCGCDLLQQSLSFNNFVKLLNKYPNLYIDASGMTYPNKFYYFKKYFNHKWIFSRLMFASDYPIPNYPILTYPTIKLKNIKDIPSTLSPPDKYYLTLKKLGVPDEVFVNISKLIKCS